MIIESKHIKIALESKRWLVRIDFMSTAKARKMLIPEISREN